MSSNSCCTEKTSCAKACTAGAYFVGIIGAFLIIGVLAWLVVSQDRPAVDAVAAANRKTVREKLDQDAATELARYSIDAAKENLARLSVDRAMEVMVAEWGGSSTDGRAKLLERLESSKKTQSFE
jgi:hypothetical protein